MATPTRFELAISALTGPYVKPLHHGATHNKIQKVILGSMLTRVNKNNSERS